MSDKTSDSKEQYHERPVGRDDVMAVASLLGQVSGSLKEIDKRNVGGAPPAARLDPKQALSNFVSDNTTGTPINTRNNVTSPVVQQVQNQPVSTVPAPVMTPTHPVTVTQTDDIIKLEKRILALEKIVETYKVPIKFKRGISYNITTSKISGEFKDPGIILDIITTELAKATKTITIKLNDKTKDR